MSPIHDTHSLQKSAKILTPILTVGLDVGELSWTTLDTNEQRKIFIYRCFIDTKVASCGVKAKKKASSDELAFLCLGGDRWT